MERCFNSLWGRGGQGTEWLLPSKEIHSRSGGLFRVTARTYFAMAVKAKSTLRPVLALVSMKGSPYSCKQLLPARWQPGGDSPSPAALGTPLAPHPTLAHLGQLLPILPLHHTLLGRVHLAQGSW